MSTITTTLTAESTAEQQLAAFATTFQSFASSFDERSRRHLLDFIEAAEEAVDALRPTIVRYRAAWIAEKPDSRNVSGYTFKVFIKDLNSLGAKTLGDRHVAVEESLSNQVLFTLSAMDHGDDSYNVFSGEHPDGYVSIHDYLSFLTTRWGLGYFTPTGRKSKAALAIDKAESEAAAKREAASNAAKLRREAASKTLLPAGSNITADAWTGKTEFDGLIEAWKRAHDYQAVVDDKVRKLNKADKARFDREITKLLKAAVK